VPLGQTIRRLLGPLEKPAAECYRGVFVDLSSFVGQIRQWSSGPNILELGCGEGAVVERVAKMLPHATITGIDITPRVGRMFQGDTARVTFRQQAIKEFAATNAATFDLLIVCDALHHIPWELHEELLADAKKVLKAGGILVLKDWVPSRTPIHLLCYLADRYITGDQVRYKSAQQLQAVIERVFGAGCIKARARIRPWANNAAFLVQA